MKKAVLSCICLALFAFRAEATLYSFTPTSGNLNNLDHNEFFSWGINWLVPAGQTITSATLSFSKIWDWQVEPDALFIHLLDTAPVGVTAWTDNEGGGDFFESPTFKSLNIASVKIGQWSDPNGGDPTKAQNVSFTFNTAQLTALQGYINSVGPSGWARFGLGFDPDCHYFNSGVTFTITTQGTSVPEGGSTALLLILAAGSIGILRRKFGVEKSR